MKKVYSDRKREWCWSILKNPHPGIERVRFCRFLIRVGYTQNEIFDLIDKYNCWDDYDPKITSSQIYWMFKTHDPKLCSPEYYQNPTIEKYTEMEAHGRTATSVAVRSFPSPNIYPKPNPNFDPNYKLPTWGYEQPPCLKAQIKEMEEGG